MNVFRVAVMKNVFRVIAVHNHPTGRLIPPDADKDITDRLIQEGRILNIEFVSHLVISTAGYTSFKSTGLMGKLEKRLKYVPIYQVVEHIREEEKKIAKQKLDAEKDKTESAREKAKELEQQLIAAVHFLKEKNISIEQIAQILNLDTKKVNNLLKMKK